MKLVVFMLGTAKIVAAENHSPKVSAVSDLW